MSSKCAISWGPASAKLEEWNDEDLEDFEFVSSGGDPGEGSIDIISEEKAIGRVKERTRGL